MSRYNINVNVDESGILPNLLGTEDFVVRGLVLQLQFSFQSSSTNTLEMSSHVNFQCMGRKLEEN